RRTTLRPLRRPGRPRVRAARGYDRGDGPRDPEDGPRCGPSGRNGNRPMTGGVGAVDLTTAEYPTPELVECPFAFYDALRKDAPVHRLPNGDYVVSRWEDVVHVSRHPELYSCALGQVNPGWEQAFASEGGGDELFTPWPLPFTDPPEHKLKRSLLMPLVSR